MHHAKDRDGQGCSLIVTNIVAEYVAQVKQDRETARKKAQSARQSIPTVTAKKDNKTMANPNTSKTTTSKSNPAAPPANVPPSGKDANTSGQNKDGNTILTNQSRALASADVTRPLSAATAKRGGPASRTGELQRFYSAVEPTYTFRILKEYVEQFGPPEHGGKPMVLGSDPARRANRSADKEAEKARLAAMSDEEKMAYAKQKREERKQSKDAKKKAEREELLAQLRREIAEGKA